MSKIRNTLVALMVPAMIFTATPAQAFEETPVRDYPQVVEQVVAPVKAPVTSKKTSYKTKKTVKTTIRTSSSPNVESRSRTTKSRTEPIQIRRTSSVTPVASSEPQNLPASSAYGVAVSSYKGVPYVWGGKSRKGWDCSGFITYVYENAGMKIGRWTTRSIKTDPRLKRTSTPRPGDIVYNSPTHAGIYIGNIKGTPSMISARNPQAGTTITPVKFGYVNKSNIKYFTTK